MEHSKVSFQELEQYSLRLDAEYYRPYFLEIEKTLKGKTWDFLSNLRISIKSFGAYSLCNQVNYKESGIPFLRCKDIKRGHIDFSDVLFIDEATNNLLWKSQVFPNTVLFTMSGTVGNSAIASEDFDYPINSNQDIAKIITNEKINPYTLSIFLQSKFGRGQTNRLPIGSVQQHIFLWQLDRLMIPLFGKNFENLIEKTYKLSSKCRASAISELDQAQDILISNLELKNWRPEHQLSFIKNFSDTENANRVDAEYFQPKYAVIVDAIKGYFNGSETVKKILTIHDKNFIPQKNVDYKYIELANIGGFGEITDVLVSKGEDLPSRARRKVSTGDVIVSSVEGSLSSVSLITEEYNDALCSTGFYVVTSSKINSETLFVLMKSMICQLQLKKGCSGTILTAINKEEFEKIILPVLDDSIQNQIKDSVQKSFNMRFDSQKFLELAIMAVEMAIEIDEQNATNWLKHQIAQIIGDKNAYGL